MIKSRDVIVALIAISATLVVVAVAQSQTPVMSSSVFEWNTIAAKKTEFGTVRQFFRAPTATVEELECHVTTLNPGQTPHPPHRHVNEEMIIIQEGTVEASMNGELKRLGKGSVIFNASNQLHAIRNVGSTPATYHVINWKSPGMTKQD